MTESSRKGKKFCATLSKQLNCSVMFIKNYKNTSLYMVMYSSGKVIFDYDSCYDCTSHSECIPRIDGLDKLLAAFAKQNIKKQVFRILRYEESIPEDRHSELVKALQLSPYSTVIDYSFIRNNYPSLKTTKLKGIQKIN